MRGKYFYLPKVAALLTFLISGPAFVGWINGDPLLSAIADNGPKMHPLASLLFLFISSYLFINHRLSENTKKSSLLILSGILLPLSIACLSDSRLSLAKTLFPDDKPIAFFTIISFILFSLGLIALANGWRRSIPAQLIFLTVFFLGLIGISGYIFNVRALGDFGSEITPMSFPASLCFITSGLGYLFIKTNEGLMKVFTSRTNAGHFLRISIPLIVVISILIGRLNLYSYYSGYLTNETCVAILVLSNIFFFPVILWFIGIKNYRFERKSKEFQETFIRSEKTLSAILNSIDEAIFVTDLDSNISYMNPVAERMTGRTIRGDKKKPLKELIRLTKSSKILKNVRKAIDENANIYNNEIDFYTINTNEIPVRYSISPLKDHTDKVSGAIISIRDISKEFEALQKERLLASIVSSSLDAIVTINKDFRITSWNKASENFFGYTEEEAKGQPYRELIPIDFMGKDPMKIYDIIRDKGFWVGEVKHRKKNGDQKYILLSSVSQKDHEGNFAGFHVIMKDISVRKSLEETISKFNEDLEQKIRQRTTQLEFMNEKLWREIDDHRETLRKLNESNKALEIFVYRASHDLKGPVASIEGLMKVARKDPEQTESAKKYFTMVDTVVEKMKKTLNGLLRAVRIGTQELVLTPIDFKKILSDIRDVLQADPVYADIEFIITIDHSNFQSDEIIISSILQNLIENAAKYRTHDIRRKPKVEVTIQDKGSSIEITVKDNGIGIPKELQEKVFELYFRGNQFTQGTGLGLFVVKQAVERLKGEISLVSEENIGTVIRVTIPRANSGLSANTLKQN